MSCSRFVRTKRRTPIAWESSMFPIPKRTRHGIPCSHRKIVVKANSSQTESVGPMSDGRRVSISIVRLFRTINVAWN